MKQTAVEWLSSELYEKFEMRGDGILFDEIIEQAKQIEKHYLLDFYWEGSSNLDSKKEAEQHYNETFKKK